MAVYENESEKWEQDENKKVRKGLREKGMVSLACLCTSFNLLSQPCARPCKPQSDLITLSVFYVSGFCLPREMGKHARQRIRCEVSRGEKLKLNQRKWYSSMRVDSGASLSISTFAAQHRVLVYSPSIGFRGSYIVVQRLCLTPFF